MKSMSMLSYARDYPNITSLAGLLSAVTGIYFAILGQFSYAIIGIIWAVFFDWADGIIARKMKNRTDDQRSFGAQLDSMIDVVSFGVFPAVFLLSYGGFGPWFLPGAFLLVATSTIRLSYFNTFGLINSSTYHGLALDNNVILMSFVYLFHPFFSRSVFAIVLYILLMIMMVFNLAPIQTPKFGGKWFYALLIYSLAISIILILI